MTTSPAPRRAGRTVAALLLVAAACGEADPVAAPSPVGRQFTVVPALLDAIGDAESRLAPSLGSEARPATRDALAELRDALDAGDRPRSARAASDLRALLASSATTEALPDRVAIALLVDLAAAATAP